jgi:hypothetical protein
MVSSLPLILLLMRGTLLHWAATELPVVAAAAAYHTINVTPDTTRISIAIYVAT